MLSWLGLPQFHRVPGQEVPQNWPSQFETAQSSIFVELLAVSLSAMKAFVESVKAQTVKWFTNNQNVARIVISGLQTSALQGLAMNIHPSC